MTLEIKIQMTNQRLGQKVYSQRIRIREYLRKWSLFTERKGTNVISGPSGGDGIELVKSGCSQDVENEGKLMVVVSTRE